MGKSISCHLNDSGAVNGHRPSVDVMFRSAGNIAHNVVAVLLTGMGNDGASGLLGLRKAGAITIGQDEETCTVYGMPRVAADLGAVMCQSALPKIGCEILTYCTKGKTASA